MPENQPQVPVADPPAPAAPGALASPPGSLAASVAPPGSAVPPVDPVVPQAPSTGAPVVDPSAPAAETPPAQEPPTPEFIPRAVHEEQFRRLQGAKDKEIADLTKQLQGVQAQPAVPQGQPTPEEFNNEQFFKQLDTDPKGALSYLTDSVRREVMASVQTHQQQHQQQQDAYSQYVGNFRDATDGFTPEELQRAQEAVQQSFTEGRPVTPDEAAMIGRFGSVQNAMNYAQHHMAAIQPAPAAPGTPPVVPGSAPGQIQSPQGEPSQDGPGSWKKMFAD